MTKVIDLDGERGKSRRKPKEPEPPETIAIYVCECGCAMWRLHSDGVIECLNCMGQMTGLAVVESVTPL